MYIIVNKTTGKNIKYEGHFPGNILDEMLDKGDKLIVISLYSNTIKVPKREYDHWSYEDFHFEPAFLYNNQHNYGK